MKYFKSSDAMIKYYNENLGAEFNIKLIYSTPSMYIDSLAEEQIEWPTKYDDIFPYADDKDSYWTGYFSSRANDKGYMRTVSHHLHSSNKLFSMSAIN
jgi:lysosomal alpha-mannosidase